MIVVDTSVAFKWFSTEKDSEVALKLLKKHLEGEQLIMVPDLMYQELSNAWGTKSALETEEITQMLELFKKYQLKMIPAKLEILVDSIEFAKRYKVSVYDAVYAVIAREYDCNLITADQKFHEKVKQKYIKIL